MRLHHLPERFHVLRSQFHRVDNQETISELEGYHLERHAILIGSEEDDEVLILCFGRIQRERACCTTCVARARLIPCRDADRLN